MGFLLVTLFCILFIKNLWGNAIMSLLFVQNHNIGGLKVKENFYYCRYGNVQIPTGT